MPVTTRRGRLRAPAHSPPVQTAARRVVNATAMSAANSTVQTVPTALQPNTNSNVTNANNSTKDPKIARFTGTSDALRVEPFLNIFERYFSNLEDDSKVLKLGEYLSGDALNFFGTDIIVDTNIDWSQTRDKLIARYGHSDIAPMVAAIRRRLVKHESIKQYFDDKCRYLRQERGLSEAAQTQLLTEGLPDVYRHHFYGRRFNSTSEWLQTAQDIEADLNRQNRYFTHNQSSAHINRTDQHIAPKKPFVRTEFKPKDKRPPYPCKFCREQGITAFHWHSDCPQKPSDASTKPKPEETQTYPKEVHFTQAQALVSPTPSGEEPILVKTFIANKKVMAFVDTGANVNLIPESVVYEFKLILNRRASRPVKTASGFAQTLGSVTFSLTIDGITKTIDALVIRGFDYTLLLSRNTCHRFKLLIDTDVMTAKPKQMSTHCLTVTQTSLQTIGTSTDCQESAEIQNQVSHRSQVLVKELIHQFSHLFATDATDLGRIDLEEHRIVLTDDIPLAQRPYRQSVYDADETARQIRELLAKGLIRESLSPYAAPITLADKKDGSKRLCVDYRRLNKKTVADKTPMPLIADVIDRLQGSTIFSKLDFASGYWQIPVRSEDIAKTAFVTNDGHFEWLVLPFGLKNSPSTFHRLCIRS